jgi:hypothetical protein
MPPPLKVKFRTIPEVVFRPSFLGGVGWHEGKLPVYLEAKD